MKHGKVKLYIAQGQGEVLVADALSLMSLQVLEEGKDRPLAVSLAEYNRVRKPDMDALHGLDTISSRIWGGMYRLSMHS